MQDSAKVDHDSFAGLEDIMSLVQVTFFWLCDIWRMPQYLFWCRAFYPRPQMHVVELCWRSCHVLWSSSCGAGHEADQKCSGETGLRHIQIHVYIIFSDMHSQAHVRLHAKKNTHLSSAQHTHTRRKSTHPIEDRTHNICYFIPVWAYGHTFIRNMCDFKLLCCLGV